MGIDGWASVTIYGPKASLDILEANKFTIPAEDYNRPIPVVVGDAINYEHINTISMDTLNEHYFKDNDRINRVHERKLVISYDYRNSPIYHYILLQLVKHPKCCIRNFYETENGDGEVMVARFNSKGEINIECKSTCGPENYHDWPEDTDYSRYNNDFTQNIRSSICDVSHIEYRLHARGPLNDISQLRQTLESRNIRIVDHGNDSTLNCEFITQDVSPIEFCETHIMKYKSCWTEVYYNDTTGVEGKSWGVGNNYEFKMFTKDEEQHLEDFSKKD